MRYEKCVLTINRQNGSFKSFQKGGKVMDETRDWLECTTNQLRYSRCRCSAISAWKWPNKLEFRTVLFTRKWRVVTSTQIWNQRLNRYLSPGMPRNETHSRANNANLTADRRKRRRRGRRRDNKTAVPIRIPESHRNCDRRRARDPYSGWRASRVEWVASASGDNENIKQIPNSFGSEGRCAGGTHKDTKKLLTDWFQQPKNWNRIAYPRSGGSAGGGLCLCSRVKQLNALTSYSVVWAAGLSFV